MRLSTRATTAVLVAAACASLAGCSDNGSAAPARTQPVSAATQPSLPLLPPIVEIAEIEPGDSLNDYINASDAILVATVVSASFEKEVDTGDIVHRIALNVDKIATGELSRTTFDVVEPAFSDTGGHAVSIRGGRFPSAGDQLVVFVRVTDPTTESVALLNTEGYLVASDSALRGSHPTGTLVGLLSGITSVDALLEELQRSASASSEG